MIVGGLFPRVLLDMGVGVAPTAIVDGAYLATSINGRKGPWAKLLPS